MHVMGPFKIQLLLRARVCVLCVPVQRVCERLGASSHSLDWNASTFSHRDVSNVCMTGCFVGRPYRAMIRSWAGQSASPYPCRYYSHANRKICIQIQIYRYRKKMKRKKYMLKQIYSSTLCRICIRRCLYCIAANARYIHIGVSVDATMSTHGSWACVQINVHVFTHAARILVCDGICVQCGKHVLLLRACSAGFGPLPRCGLVLSRAT